MRQTRVDGGLSITHRPPSGSRRQAPPLPSPRRLPCKASASFPLRRRLRIRIPPLTASNNLALVDQPSILEKSATARVAARISLSSFSRFSRSAASSTLTVTWSKKAST